MEHELLAQIVEELSVLASDHRYKEPRQVARPFQAETVTTSRTVTTQEGYEMPADAAATGINTLFKTRRG